MTWIDYFIWIKAPLVIRIVDKLDCCTTESWIARIFTHGKTYPRESTLLKDSGHGA